MRLVDDLGSVYSQVIAMISRVFHRMWMWSGSWLWMDCGTSGPEADMVSAPGDRQRGVSSRHERTGCQDGGRPSSVGTFAGAAAVASVTTGPSREDFRPSL